MNEKICPKCQGNSSYDELFDSVYCVKCNVWLEKICSDDNCYYCRTRPEKPSTKKILLKKYIYKDLFVRRLQAILNEITCMSDTTFDTFFKEGKMEFNYMCWGENSRISTSIKMIKNEI